MRYTGMSLWLISRILNLHKPNDYDKCQIIRREICASDNLNFYFCFLLHLQFYVDFLFSLCRVTQLPDGISATVQLIVLLSQLMGPL